MTCVKCVMFVCDVCVCVMCARDTCKGLRVHQVCDMLSSVRCVSSVRDVCVCVCVMCVFVCVCVCL